jgi:hypothetical protein
MAKEFRAPVSSDFEIIENGKTVCWIRVRPSGILWSQKGGHSWQRVTIERFAAFARKKGEKVKK